MSMLAHFDMHATSMILGRQLLFWTVCKTSKQSISSSHVPSLLNIVCRVFDAQNAVDMAQQLLEQGRDVKGVANRLLNEAIRERKCKDNVTVMLVRFPSVEGGAS